MKFGHYLQLNLIPEWREWYVEYNALKKLLKDVKEDNVLGGDAGEDENPQEDTRMVDEVIHFDILEEMDRLDCDIESLTANEYKFLHMLVLELRKVHGFYKQQLDSLRETLDRIAPQVAALQVVREKLNQRRFGILRKATGQQRLLFNKKRRRLMKAMRELYRGIQLLKNFGVLNKTAFAKITKKHDKVTCRKLKDSFMNLIDVDVGPTKKSLESLEEDVEGIYAESMKGGSREKAMGDLRVLKTRKYYWDTFVIGFVNGISFLLILLMIWIFVTTPRPEDDAQAEEEEASSYYFSPSYSISDAVSPSYDYSFVSPSFEEASASEISPDAQDEDEEVLDDIIAYDFFTPFPFDQYPQFLATWMLFRGMGLPILMILLYGIDVKVWTKFRVNFVFIYMHNLKNFLSYHRILMAGSILAMMWVIAVFMYVVIGAGIIDSVMPAEYMPLILLGALLVILFFPLGFFYRPTRGWLIWTSFRVVLPFWYSVKFKDFFLADQFTSLVVVLFDLEFLICFYSVDVWNGGDVCMTRVNRIARPCLAFLPSFWRLCQCLRRYYTTRDTFPHLVNGGKYASTGLVVASGALYAFVNSPFTLAFWVLCLVFSSFYATSWDLLEDWGLLNKTSKNLLLRDRITYNKYFYYWAIVTDILLRFAWGFVISPAFYGVTFAFDMYLTIFAVLEVFR